MPAYKCNNGKWKFGQTGSCKYDSKAEAENDNKDYYRAVSDIDLTPTQGMIDEAKKGLEWRKEFGRGGTNVGVTTARMIINNSLTPDRVTRMFAFHSRHQVDKKAEGYEVGEKGYPSNGRIAIALWGGDFGFAFSERKRKEIVKEEEKRVSAKIKKSLEKKRDDHNEEVKGKNLGYNASVTLNTLEKVFDRGVGAYHTNPQSVRPSVKSPEQWALARTNSFLYALKNGKFRSGKHDTDLLPKNHPVRKKLDEKKYYMENENRQLVGTMITDGIEMPLYSTKEEAENVAKNMGGSGSHEHELDGVKVYMPFNSHDDILSAMEDGKEKTEEAHYHKDEEKKPEKSGAHMEEEDTEKSDAHMEDEEKPEKSGAHEEDEEKPMKRNDNPNIEKRTFSINSSIETREIDGQKRNVVVGYGSVYNSRSENLGNFYEYIKEGAFTQDLINRSDTRALINHDPNLILARSKYGEGTLKLSADSKGLRYEFEMPNTTYANDLLVNMKNNNINQSSFAFTVKKDSWSNDDDGNNVRTIEEIDSLYDISVVTYPAYSQAERDVIVAQRGLKEFEETKKLVKHSLLGLKLEIKKRK